MWTYYSGFCLVEAQFIISGFGYSKKDEKEEYNSIRSVKIWEIESACEINPVSTCWNINVHNWLKYYVMLRLMDRSKPKGSPQYMAQLWTYLASGLWHGLYPGFAVLFFFAALIEIHTKTVAKLKITAAFK